MTGVVSRAALLAAALTAVPLASLVAQAPLTITCAAATCRTGALRLPVGEEPWQLIAAVAREEGDPAPVGSAVRWTSSNPRALEVVRVDGPSAWVLPRGDAIGTITALTREGSVTLPFVIGRAGLTGEPVRPPEGSTAAQYLPARIVLTGPARLDVGAQGVQVIAAVYNAAEGLVNAAEFPIAWSSSAPGVVRIGRDDADRSAYVDAVAPGTATVTARAEGGVSGSLTIAVGGVVAARPDLQPIEPALLDRPAETRTVDVPQLRLQAAFGTRTFQVSRLTLVGRFGPRRIRVPELRLQQ